MKAIITTGFLVLCLSFLWVMEANGQIIQGRLIDEATGQPVEGALVRLFDAAGNARDGYLTNSSGRFRLTAPGPGTFTAVADRIGFRSAESMPLSMQQGDVIDVELRTAFAPIPLDAIKVEGEKSCVVRPDEGEVLTRLWEEAQKVLVAQDFAAGDDTYPFSILRYTRTFDDKGMGIRSEELQRRTVVAPTAIRSRGADDLLNNGFVQLKDGDDPVYEYYGPDAEVLLSEGFLDSHCFRLGDVDEEAGLVGIGFEPVRRDGPPDIEGTFWLSLADTRLTALDFRYDWAPALEAEGHARGRIGFEELPNGGWIIREWWIRTPILTPYYARGHGIRHRIVGFSEEGEEITRLSTEGLAGVEHPRGSIRGLVWDSTRGAPLPDATVYLSGTQHSAETTTDGRFTLDGLREGRYTLAFFHPGLDTLGVSIAGSEIEVAEGEPTDVALTVPPVHSLLASLCPDQDVDAAFLTGTVTDAATGRTRSSANVSLVWTDYDVPGGREIRGTRRSVDVTTDSQGRYRACGISPGAAVTIRASIGACAGPVFQTAVPSGQINQMHLSVDQEQCGPGDAPVLVCPSGGIHPEKGAVEGKVVDAATNVPVGLVDVRVVALEEISAALDRAGGPSAPVTIRADAAGRFQVCPLEPGRYRILAEGPAMGQAEVEVEIPAGELAYLTLGLERHAPAGRTGSIVGRVVAAETGDPVPAAELTLGPSGQTTTSDRRGLFRFFDIEPGSVTLLATHLSFGEAEGQVSVSPGRVLEVAIQLSPDPIDLDPIVVEANRTERNIYLAEVQRRATRGLGTVLLSEDLDRRRSAGRTTDLLFEYGVYVIGTTPSQRAIYMSRTPSCAPTVYIDGIRVANGGGKKFGGLDGGPEAAQAIDLVHPLELEAMEIYRGPAQTPGEYIDSNSQCGVILLWTKRGTQVPASESPSSPFPGTP